MAYSQVQYGSQGGDVRKLQQMLNKGGYKLEEDGIFGVKTQAAVRDYQKKNKLDVDGIVGKNTWASLTAPVASNATKVATNSAAKTTPTKASSPTSTAGTVGQGFKYDDFQYDGFNYDKEFTSKDFQYDDFKHDAYKESEAVTAAKQALDAQAANKPGAYQESEVVAAAKAALEAQMGQKPGEYKSQWQNQLNDTINKILNREEFSYDLNGDALYQQYKDKYIQQGKMAMADTMGQAAAMTGGYGSSYAASVGNQAYQQSLQQLNDVVPELYQMAYDRYNQEGQNLYNQYAMLGERENAEYGRHRDAMSDWQAERDYLTGRYDTERSIDYGMHRDDVSDYQAERDYLTGRYDTERNLDYSKYTDDRNFAYNQYADDRNFAYGQHVDDRNFAYNQYVDDRNFEYGKYADDRNFAYGQYADDKSYAYNDYRNQIEDKQWQATFDEGVRQYNEQFEYQQGRDQVADSQWQATFDEGIRQYNEQFKYQQGRDQVADSQWDKTFQYQQNRDQVADSQWQQVFDYNKGRDEVADSQWKAEFDEAKRQWDETYAYQQGRDEVEDRHYWNEYNAKYGNSSSNSSGSSNSNNTTPNYNNGSLSTSQIKELQKALGVEADGLYGKNSMGAAGGLSAEEAYKKYVTNAKASQGTKKYTDFNMQQFDENSKANGGSHYESVLGDLKQMKAKGVSNKEVQAYLSELAGNSYITPSDYKSLYNKYRDNKLK